MSKTSLVPEPIYGARSQTLGRALDDIDAVARHILANDRRDAFEAAHVIATMIDTVRGHYDGKLSSEDTAAELLVLRQSITEAADPDPSRPDTVDARFDPGEPP